ncbi:MAG: glycosyltransferase family 4 protein [Nitrososphaeria archaeon]
MHFLHIYFNPIKLETGEIYHHIIYLIKSHASTKDKVIIVGLSITNKYEVVRYYKNIILVLLPIIGDERSFFRIIKNLMNVHKVVLYLLKIFKPDIIFLHHFPLSFLAPVYKLISPKTYFVKKYYGTLIYGLIRTVENKSGKIKIILRVLPELISYVLPPTDLLLMLDDGTQGYKICNLLKIKKYVVVPQVYYTDVIPEVIIEDSFTKIKLCETLGIHLSESKISKLFIVLYVARLDSWKRIDRFLIVAAKTLMLFKKVESSKSSTPFLLFVIAGGGKLINKYRSLVKKLGLANNIIFLGNIERQKLKILLSVADLYLCMYDHSCVGIATTEAMASGICTIAIDTGDTKRLLEGGAIIVDSKKAEDEIPSIIMKLFYTPKNRLEWSERAKKHVNVHFLEPEIYWDYILLITKNKLLRVTKFKF